MNIYTISNITPKNNPSGLLESIRFSLSARGFSEDIAEASWVKVYPTPSLDTSAYSDDNWNTLCASIALENDMYVGLDTVLRNMAAPLTQVPMVVPTPTLIAPLTLDEQKKAWMIDIDDRIADIYSRFQRFQMEYTTRESVALAFKAAGYTGDATTWISTYANNMDITYQEATDRILSQASALRMGIFNLANIRMGKYTVLNSNNVDQANAAYFTILAKIIAIDKVLI